MPVGWCRDGGSGITNAGVQVGAALQGIPLVGEGAAAGVRGAFSGAGDPLMQFGTDLERLLIVVAALLGLLLVAVALTPWLNRYLPWRVARWRRLNAASSRRFDGVVDAREAELPRRCGGDAACSRRARSTDSSTTSYSSSRSDPFGDWVAGRHDRLAQAELDRVGLRSVAASR